MNRARTREAVRNLAHQTEVLAANLPERDPYHEIRGALETLADAVRQLCDVSEDQDS